MTSLLEFKVSKTIFDDVKNDPEFRIGFEAEFHVRYAVDLLKDQNGDLPQDFETFNAYDQVDLDTQYGQQRVQSDMYYEETALVKLCRMFEGFLGLAPNDISIEDTGYTKWKLMVDPSLYKKASSLKSPDDDMGVELISPVMPLKDGLTWIAKVFDMIEQFKQDDITLYTSDLCGFHVNLSHIRMGTNFDYAKLAIMSGDQHYLQDFDRMKNTYAAPLMRAVYDSMVAAKEKGNTPQTQQALGLLNIKGWNPQRVMTDLSALIPMDHHMSVDLSRLATNNPYIEVRIAGNRGYEKRFADIAKLTIRFGALIKIACDPYDHREEYLKKIYQLVSSVAPVASPQQTQQQNQFPMVRVYLSPIMNRVTRDRLDMIELQSKSQSLTVQTASYMFLQIVRGAMDMRMTQNLRVRHGLIMLLNNVLRISVPDLMKALKNNALLVRYGVIRNDKSAAQVIVGLTNFLKTLNQGV